MVNRWIVARGDLPRPQDRRPGVRAGAVTKLILERLDDARNTVVIGIDPSPSALAKAGRRFTPKSSSSCPPKGGAAEWGSRLVSSARRRRVPERDPSRPG